MIYNIEASDGGCCEGTAEIEHFTAQNDEQLPDHAIEVFLAATHTMIQ
jgi:hypothetical protein